MADSFKKLVSGINPLATTSTEWFSVPADHEYQGYVRVAHVGSSGSGTTSYQLAGVAGTGVTPGMEDYEAYNTSLEEGEIHDLTMDLTELETLIVYADSANVSFNYRGLDIDNA
jgi:hypothetical protein